MLEQLQDYWPVIVTVLHGIIGVSASAHAVLWKRDVRSTIGWVGIIWLTPFLGAMIYVLFGVNRIQRRARLLRPAHRWQSAVSHLAETSDDVIHRVLTPDAEHLTGLIKVVGGATNRGLLPGNRVEPLITGDEAYPAMLAAIDNAQRSITLCTYIFDNDQTGQTFLEALSRAVARGVEVRVLIDDLGSRYTWPSIVGSLRSAGIPVAKFLPTLVPSRFRYTNLRCHRKILVIDGRQGFTGGMNLRDGNDSRLGTQLEIRDIHFRLAGPVVSHLQDVFAADWAFCTAEVLEGDVWFPQLEPDGPILARGIPDGPDEDFDILSMTLLGALSCARSRIVIVTPYFLPDASLGMALDIAAMRGVEVDIVLPQKNNLRLVQWATMGTLWSILARGCRVWLVPPPFDHSKLMLVDGVWTLLGSANWDPRSLRLNFEFNVECYDRELTHRLANYVDSRIAASRRLTSHDLDRRHFAIKLRDGIARLASPYL